MGSRGSGRLTDYPGSSKERKTGGAGGGGPTPEDRCDKALTTTLEDVEHCAFFKAHNSSPKVGTDLQIAHKKRIVAMTAAGEIVGNLPTKFNYLAGCLRSGFSYVGKVVDSSNGPPVAKVMADFAPASPN